MKGFGSKSIVSPLKIGKKEKAASQMREMRETCDDGKRGDEPLRLTVHKLRKHQATRNKTKKKEKKENRNRGTEEQRETDTEK